MTDLRLARKKSIRRILSQVTLLALSPLSTYSCKSTDPQPSLTKSAEETQGEIKSDVTALLQKPAEDLLTLLEPLATQFKSLQQMKAQAEGFLEKVSMWADQQVAEARKNYKENAILWEAATILAGPDGLLNYEDVKNTLMCMPDEELKASIDYALSAQIAHSSGYKKRAVESLRRNFATNGHLATYKNAFAATDLMNRSSRDGAIQNEIDRQIALTLSEQCAIPMENIHGVGVLDLVKTYCIKALDWRSQGVFVGLLHLHYDSQSIDKPGSCSNRIITAKMFRDLYDKYFTKGSGNKKTDKKYIAAMNFLHLQTSKFFGPFDSAKKPISLTSNGEDRIANHILDIPESVQITLEGGLPVAAMKGFLDDFSAGNNHLLGEKLGQMSRNLKVTPKCKAVGNLFVPTKNLGTEKLAFTYYKDEDELRAYFDPKVDGNAYLRSHITDPEKLNREILNARYNKNGATLNKSVVNGVTQYLHQMFDGLTFIGERVSTLAVNRFTKLPDGRIRLDSMYLEQAIEGSFTVSIQRPDDRGGFELVEYEGYAVPYTKDSARFITPCLEFVGAK